MITATALATLILGNPLPPPVPKFILESPKSVKAGASTKVTVKFSLPDGWHCYTNPAYSKYEVPLEFKLIGKEAKLVKAEYPSGVPFGSEEAQNKSTVYEGLVTVPITLQIDSKTKVGKLKLTFEASYQMCSETSCLPPTTIKKDVTILVEKA